MRDSIRCILKFVKGSRRGVLQYAPTQKPHTGLPKPDIEPFNRPHEVDELGYPIDPLLNQLQTRLGGLAADWRGLYRAGDKKRNKMVAEYHETMKRLYELGWDDILDVDAELPDEFMPEEYLKRHPRVGKW